MKKQTLTVLICTSFLALLFQNCAGETDLNVYTGASEGSAGAEVLALQVDSQSQSSTQNIGADVDFIVAISGSNNITYQWYKDDVAVTGAVSTTLTLQSLVAGDAGTYYLIALDGNAERTKAQSVDIILTIAADLKVTEYNNPRFLIGGVDYILYTTDQRTVVQKALTQKSFCIAKTNNTAATVESAIEAANNVILTRLAFHYFSADGVCPNTVGYLNIKSPHICGFFNGTTFSFRPYAKIVCRIP